MRLSRALSFHDQIRQLRIIFFILLIGQVIYFLVAWLLKADASGSSEFGNLFDYLVPVILFSCIFVSRFLYRLLIGKAITFPFIKKLENYRAAVLVSLGLLEGGNIISITAFILTGDYLFAAASVIMFLLFILNSPSEERFRMDLQLSPEELVHTE